MIIEFSAGNYRSFKEIQSLSLQAAKIKSKDKEIDRNNVFQLSEKYLLLKTKAIYGANASGKSNIILALRDFKKIATSSLKDDQVTSNFWLRHRYRLGEKNQEPIFFQLIFSSSNIIYRYGFEILEESICSEWLYGIPNEKEVYFFEREGMNIRINENQFKEGKRIVSSSKDVPLFRNNSLFLAVVAAFNGPLSKSIMFQIDTIKGVITSNFSKKISKTLTDSLKNDLMRKKITAIMKSIDGGIEHVMNSDFGDILKAGFNSNELSEDQISSLNEAVITIRNRYNDQGEKIGLEFFYMEDEEAEGNKRLAQLSPFILEALENGSCLVIDEFDAHLHPNLTRKIVELFQNTDTNSRNAQLIFTTHDSNLLDPHLLRRDQICFVEKDKFGASTLTNLVEFKGVRNDASYEKDYLRGKYGAVPYLGKFERAFENFIE